MRLANIGPATTALPCARCPLLVRCTRSRSRSCLLLTAFAAAISAVPRNAHGQRADTDSTAHPTPAQLHRVIVTARAVPPAMGVLPATQDGAIFAGKKTEVITLDSLNANLAQDVERQMLGRIPGAHISETEGAGFPSNGIAFRGLDPTQSVEMNVRQNGVNIAADIFGYPETYYTPPPEALARMEIVRGAASLAFGPQFGGMIDYVVRDGSPGRPQFTTTLTAGSYGAVNFFDAIGGGSDSLTYYAFIDARREDGWRPNADFRQAAGFGRVTWRPSARLTLGAELTLFRNQVHMAGGLDDSAFAADPRASFRARNWLESPWNVAALHARYDISATARLENTLSYVQGSRALVWRNEDGGPGAPDLIDPATGDTIPREVEQETFGTLTLESRLLMEHDVFSRPGTLSAGVRVSSVEGSRYEGGTGTNGDDPDFHLVSGTWETALRLHTGNVAGFAEDMIRLSDRLTLVPGLRIEWVRSSVSGYTDVTDRFAPITYTFPLFGVGASYVTGASTELYANLSQAYRPVLYSSLTPLGSVARVSPDLHSSRGANADFGWRGNFGTALSFDVGLFYLWYGDRIGTRTVSDSSGEYEEVANIGSSVHRGVESYLQLNVSELAGMSPRAGVASLFTSFGWVDARYVSGEFKGNRVEEAPEILARFGATYALRGVSTTVQVSHTASSFADANNSPQGTADAAGGPIPAYTLIDWSFGVAIARAWVLTGGVNNLAGATYFTTRTVEYPGPGILPGNGRSAYLGVRAAY